MKSLYIWLKSQIPNCYQITDIRNIDNSGDYNITFIQFWIGPNRANFSIKTTKMNLKVQIRDFKIEEILKSTQNDQDYFDVEDIIYSDKQKETLNKLRNKLPNTNHWTILNKAKKEYSDSFQIGDKVKYNGGVGFITFKHTSKHDSDITKWSVKIGDTEFRYVEGTELIKRKVEDLSHIPIDPKLDKLSTGKLLKMYKSGRDKNLGMGNRILKRILQEREHIQKGPNKIKIVNK